MFPTARKEVLIFYFLNPIVLYAIYIHSQLDLIPTALLVYSIYALVKERVVLSGATLGFALATKFHVLVVIPLLILFVFKRNTFQKAIIYSIIPFLILFLFVIAIDKINSITIPLKPLGFSKLFLAEPWYIVTLCVAGASFLSALKVGGNNGNTQVALAVMFPLFGLIANRLVYWKTIPIAWFGLILFIQREIPDHLRNYRDALTLKSQVERLYFEDSFRILTGSDVYYASRFLMNEGVLLENYWTYSLMQNNDLSSSLVRKIESNYDYLIVENFLDNLNIIQESSKYEIIFVNSLGIIAKLKSSDLSQG